MVLQDFLGDGFSCKCGRLHKTSISHIEIASGAIYSSAVWVKKSGYNNVIVVSDANTYSIAAKTVLDQLSQYGINAYSLVYQGQSVVSDELAIGRLVSVFKPDIDLIISVGSGTLNDICKFAAFRLGRPYICIGTAPSMDGYASESAAMTLNGFKVTSQACCPIALFCDTDILCNAPMEMIGAGLGDMLGKYSALCEWKMSHILFEDEYYCQEIAYIMKEGLDKCVSAANGCQRRDPESIKLLTEGLILSGIAMTFAGNSRPASGCEHHLSHFWEMRFLAEGKSPVLHGAKVGVATVKVLGFYERLAKMDIDMDKSVDKAESFDVTAWESNMRKHYGDSADELIYWESIREQFDLHEHKRRLKSLNNSWDRIKEIWCEMLPSARKVAEHLELLDAPTSPQTLGISRSLVEESIMYAKYGRARYTLLQLIWDMGLLEDFSK